MTSSSPFRFVLVRRPAEAHPRAPLGLVYRARWHGELVWVMSLSPAGATNERVARLLALLVVNQTRQVAAHARATGTGHGAPHGGRQRTELHGAADHG